MEYYQYVIILFFFIGVLRAYRNKVKDRCDTTKDEKLDDRNTKDRQKSKRGVHFLRQRKNENLAVKGVTKGEKMGSFQSKGSKRSFVKAGKKVNISNTTDSALNKTSASHSLNKSHGIIENTDTLNDHGKNNETNASSQNSLSSDILSNNNLILDDGDHKRNKTETFTESPSDNIKYDYVAIPNLLERESPDSIVNQPEPYFDGQVPLKACAVIPHCSMGAVQEDNGDDNIKNLSVIAKYAETFFNNIILMTYNEAVSKKTNSQISTSVGNIRCRFVDKRIVDSDKDKSNIEEVISSIAITLSKKIVTDVLTEFKPFYKNSDIKRYAGNLVNISNSAVSNTDYFFAKELTAQNVVRNDHCDGRSSNLNNYSKPKLCRSEDLCGPVLMENDLSSSFIVDEASDTSQPSVVLRHSKSGSSRNNLNIYNNYSKKYSGTDRPLSGYAEQLAELLAEEDLDFLDSDEELPDSLEKIKENFISKRNISFEVENIQRKCSRVELNAYGVKKFKSKIESKIHDKKNKFKGDRPLSLYEQDILGDILGNTEEEFDDKNEVEDDAISPVLSTVEFLDNNLPHNFTQKERTFSCTSSNCDSFTEELNKSDAHNYDGKVRDIGQAAVIDLGCGILKAGMCGDLEPSCYCPSVIGIPRRFSQDISKMKKGYYVGDEAWTVAGMLQIEHPIKQHVSNWTDVGNIIEHLLEYELKVNDRNHPIMLTEMGLVPSKQREKLTEIMFETFGIPAFYLANQASLALYSMGLTSGICLNSGFRCTQAIPIYEGYCIPHGTVQLDIGGDHVTSYLGRILLESRGEKFSSSSEKLVLNSIKQSLCYVAEDARVEKEMYKSTLKNLKCYTLPDGREIELDTERFLAPEILFNPTILGLNQPSTAGIVCNSINLIDSSLHPILKDNILVTGGNTKLCGFGSRLEKELSHVPASSPYHVIYADNPLLASWIGGSILSSIGTFREQWITIDHYAEMGSTIVHKMCL